MATFGFVKREDIAAAKQQVTNPRNLAGLFRQPSPFVDGSEWTLSFATYGMRDGIAIDRAVFVLKQGEREEALWLSALTRLQTDAVNGNELVSQGDFVQLCRDLAATGDYANELELAEAVVERVKKVRFVRNRLYRFYDKFNNLKTATMVDASIAEAIDKKAEDSAAE